MSKEDFFNNLKKGLVGIYIEDGLVDKIASAIETFVDRVYDDDPIKLYNNIKTTLRPKYDVEEFKLNFDKDIILDNVMWYDLILNKMGYVLCRPYNKYLVGTGNRTKDHDRYMWYVAVRGIVDLVGDKELLSIIDDRLESLLNDLKEKRK